ncbi:MAG: NADH-quinone oxidoreductase subunit N [SAR202 cluster bacterium]|nr:NADH-quinone oxidoreductase subunit N [SAR202 cluster bacterium]
MGAHDLWLLSPQLAMAALACTALVVDLATGRSKLVLWLSLIGLVIPAALSIALWAANPADTLVFFGAASVDRFSLFFTLLFTGVAAAVIVSAEKYASRFQEQRGEFVGLILASTTGMMLLASANELITIYVSLELTALPVAALLAFLREDRSAEAGMKFLILSGVSSALLLYGLVFIFGFTGTTRLDEIFARIGDLQASGGFDSTVPFGSYGLLLGIALAISGFAFKLAAAPFQMWVPDAYEGGPTPVVAFLSVASKAAGFAVVLRILYSAFGSPELAVEWSALFAVLAVVTMTLGNLMALPQKNVKRLLGYSTISQAGFMLIGLAAVSANTSAGSLVAGPQSVVFYLAGYAFTNLAVFLGVIAITNRTNDNTIAGFAGMGRRAPVTALLLAIGLISLLGLPPTVGFMSKIFVFNAAVNSGLAWLALAGVLNSVISAYYYLRVIRAMYMEAPTSDERITLDPSLGVATGIAAFGAVLFGVAPWFLLRAAEIAVRSLSGVAGS